MKHVIKPYTVDQYDRWTNEHDKKTVDYDKESRKAFYEQFTFPTQGKQLLDVACASGHDLLYYRNELGCSVHGVDASRKEVQLANNKLGEEKVKHGLASNMPFENKTMDIIVSKYAPQAFESIEEFYKETDRVLKPGGHFLILATHPMRHFLEKTKKPRDYYKKEVVTSWIYERTLPLQEWSHTINDYLSQPFLEKFNLETFIEKTDTPQAVEYIDNETYPSYFILKARKK